MTAGHSIKKVVRTIVITYLLVNYSLVEAVKVECML